MQQPIKADVLIVGAGPTGLSLACQLTRYGVDFVILEKNERVTPFSKAIGVHARTLEIYEQIDLAQRAIEQGAIAGRARFLVDGDVAGEVDLSHIGEGLSPFPFMLVLEQSKNERLLYSYLQAKKREVLWNTEFESLTQTDAGVTVRIRSADGTAQTIEAAYLVGCDGAKSMVRHALGLKFEGSTFERMFFVADAQIDWKLSHDSLYIALSREAFLLFFPLKGEDRYRIVGVFPEEFTKDEGEVLYEEIESRIKLQAKLELDIHDVEWFSTYKVHTRHVSSFSAGRSFLAGDAAHVHSPAGAQGMNTGIQDGYNLAWKIALALRGEADQALLDTYNEERLENAKELLQTTDRLFQLGAGTDWIFGFLRTNVMPSVARLFLSSDTVKHFIFPRISQIGINYRHSSFSDHAGDEHFSVKAGDRMPYFVIDGKSIYDRLHQPQFHLLVFSESPAASQRLEEGFKKQFPALLDACLLNFDDNVAATFGAHGPFSVLLRPDNYIAFIWSETAVDEIMVHLEAFFRKLLIVK